KFFALVRAGYHLCRIESLKEMLQSVLDDTLTVFNAQRGAALLRDDASGQFRVQACVPAPRPGNAGYSLTLTERCFHKGESFLCTDSLPQDAGGAQGRGSIICAIMRSPRKRLGVLQLVRSQEQEAFSNEDLQLADALAASISAGVECAQLVDRYREPF